MSTFADFNRKISEILFTKKNCQFKELKFPAKINLGYPEILKKKSVLARHIFH